MVTNAWEWSSKPWCEKGNSEANKSVTKLLCMLQVIRFINRIECVI